MKQKNNSFLVTILGHQNNSWQGIITWVEKNEKQEFRSAIELINLISSVVDNEAEEETKTE